MNLRETWARGIGAFALALGLAGLGCAGRVEPSGADPADGAIAGGAGDVPPGAPTARVLIRFPGLPTAADRAWVEAAGGQVRYVFTIVPVIAATVPSAALDALRHDPRVEGIEPDGVVFAQDAELDNSWGAKHIGAGAVHATGVSGAGVNVAIFDTGVDYTHADLDANYGGGYDFANGDTDPADDHGHGTHVAGIVAAEDDNAGVVGVAPGATIWALKILKADGSGINSDIIAALQWCTDATKHPGVTIHVTNHSYGDTVDLGTSVRQAFEAAEAAGIVHVAGAGNSGNAAGTGENMLYPARYHAAIAVGGVNSSSVRWASSSTGKHLDLVAPAVGVRSTLPGGGYANWSGTSMASPHVAGVVALMLDQGIADANGNGRVNDEIQARLFQTATDLDAPGFDKRTGHGLVNAVGATGLDQPPVIALLAPSVGAWFNNGDTVWLHATATDAEDDATALTGAITWSSDIDGALAIGGSGSVVLSNDAVHVLTASVTDSAGNTATANATVTVGSANAPPVVTITAPANGATVLQGTLVTFTGTATDAEDGALTAALAWVSDLDGALGTGGSVGLSTLAFGTHTITASATDSQGRTTLATLTLHVMTSLVVTVSTDQASYPDLADEKVRISVTVAALGAPVAGASVTVTVTVAGGSAVGLHGTTGADGAVTLKYRVKDNLGTTGTFTATADAAKSGHVAGSGSTTFDVP